MPTAVNIAEVPVLEESRPFGIDELFFSTTDKKGLIDKANHIFVRVSGFTSDELWHKPHNVVRHPEMPRAVFQIFWDYIQADRPVVAYVKNRAKDGRFYWVVALASPTPDGYLSVRFKPSSPLWSKAIDLYRHLRQVEQSIEQTGGGKKAAIAAATKELAARLRSLGFANYDEFMYALLQQELQSREKALESIPPQNSLRLGGAKWTQADPLPATVRSCDSLLKGLNPVFGDLTSYVTLNQQIRSKCEFVTTLSMSIRMLALNGAIEAEKLGSLASGIGKVLGWLQSLSHSIASECESLSKALLELIAQVNAITFNLGAAKLQITMTAAFASELIAQHASSSNEFDGNRNMTDGAIELLHGSFSETTLRALASLTAANDNLRNLRRALDRLETSTRSLRSVYVTGKIEMAGLKSSQLGSIFSDLGTQLTNAEKNLYDLNEQIEKLQTQLIKTLDDAKSIDALMADVDRARLLASAQSVS